MKSRAAPSASPPSSEEETALDATERTFELETGLATWLDQQAAKHRTTPSLLVAALLEWARDEDILEDDGGTFGQKK